MTMESYTLTLNNTNSVLEAHYYPPIQLSPHNKYVLGLVELLTFNSIPNIDIGNNKFYVGKDIITISTGSYEIEDIEKYLKTHNIDISIKPNNNTLKCSIVCNRDINFEPKDSIGRLLGFTPRILKANSQHESDLPVAILKVNVIRVECNITTDAYINENKVHTIFAFFPTCPPGYKVIAATANVIYLPIAIRAIAYLQLRIVDQNSELINFRGETITIRLHVKSI